MELSWKFHEIWHGTFMKRFMKYGMTNQFHEFMELIWHGTFMEFWHETFMKLIWHETGFRKLQGFMKFARFHEIL